MAGILRLVSAHTAETLQEALRPLTQDPRRAAVLCDIDGTLSPIVSRAEDAWVPEQTSRLLAAIARRYARVACVSGRPAAEARRLVGVGGIVYVGSHGAEMLEPGASTPRPNHAFERWAPRVREFVRRHDDRSLRNPRVRIEDKGPIAAFHWRGAPDEAAARRRVEELAREAEEEGFATHWGRKVLEVRPPVPFGKGRAVEELVSPRSVEAAMFGGDDATDLDAWDALDRLVAGGSLRAGVRVGVRSDEAPAAILSRAHVVVDGVDGFRQVLSALAEA
ncbi:MAG: trehalose-phosphatase [Thermoleophilaceae bacterium]|nr:trehalose-phosphatase [Thermoleophilaceae bacterium]